MYCAAEICMRRPFLCSILPKPMWLRKYIQLWRGSWRSHMTWTQSLKYESCIHSPASTICHLPARLRGQSGYSDRVSLNGVEDLWDILASHQINWNSLWRKERGRSGRFPFPSLPPHLAPSRNFRISTLSGQAKHLSDICSSPAFSSSFFVSFCSSFSDKSGTVIRKKCRRSPSELGLSASQ